MNPYFYYEILVGVVLLYVVAVVLLYRLGFIGANRTISLFGPALMIKTKRGLEDINRWSRFRRFWTAVSDLGIWLAAISMGLIVSLLVLGAVLSFSIPASAAPSPSEALAIPGINPLIPLWYGLIALIIGIVLHELSHGIVARSQGIGVKSVGVLWCVIPIGAFVEQDDADMMAASRRKRDRVAAAGVLANFAIAVVFFVALSAVVSSSVVANANGVGVVSVVAGSPAANISLAPGDIITSINGTATTSVNLFDSALANTRPGEIVVVQFYSATLGHSVTASTNLTKNPNVATRGFLGVLPAFLTPPALKQTLVWPLGSPNGPLVGSVDWIVLPLATLEPVGGSSLEYFHLTGPFAHVDPNTFWIGANVLYWIAWMSLLLGLSNALPLVPLDGGLLFRDFSASIAARFRKTWSETRLEEFGGKAAVASSVIVLVLLLWQFVVPRLL
ncbi:MAG TPA: site-2 protease family protein [Thermoplasmata archaeon]|nr:site-2 protease family protein [Thermoplasmata archaeon]